MAMRRSLLGVGSGSGGNVNLSPKATSASIYTVRIAGTETATQDGNRDPHTVYLLKVNYGSNAWFVKKRYSEFRKLHHDLEKELGKAALETARLPGKKMFGSLNVSVVERRKQALQKYLDDLSAQSTLWEHPYTIRFLDDASNSLTLQIEHHRLAEHVRVLEEICREATNQVKICYKMIENQDTMILELRKDMAELKAGAARSRSPPTSRSNSPPSHESSRVPSADTPPLLPGSRVVSVDTATHALERLRANRGAKSDPRRRSWNHHQYSEGSSKPTPVPSPPPPPGFEGNATDADDGSHLLLNGMLSPPRPHSGTWLDQKSAASKEDTWAPMGRAVSTDGGDHASKRLIFATQIPKIAPRQQAGIIEWEHIPRGTNEANVEAITRANASINTVINLLSPCVGSEAMRHKIVTYISDMVNSVLGVQSFAIGHLPLKTYLAEDRLEMTVIVPKSRDEDWFIELNQALLSNSRTKERRGSKSESDEDDAPLHPVETAASKLGLNCGEVNFNPDTRLLRCRINGSQVEISGNRLDELTLVALFENVDRAVGKDHLFKKTLILIKAWATYESRSFTGRNFMDIVSGYALAVMVVSIFNKHHSKLHTPLQALAVFFLVFSKFDFENAALTFTGEIPAHDISRFASSFPMHAAQSLVTARKVKEYSESYMESKRSGGGSRYTPGIVNILDPLDPTANLASTLTIDDAAEIKRLLEHGAKSLKPLLDHIQADADKVMRTWPVPPQHINPHTNFDTSAARIESFFSQCLASLGSGWRVDVDYVANPVSKETMSPSMMRSVSVNVLSAPLINGDDDNDWDSTYKSTASKVLNKNGPTMRKFDESKSSRSPGDMLITDLKSVDASLHYCALLLLSKVTEPALVTLTSVLLKERGPLPVGEIGKLLQEATSNPGIKNVIKERFNGLKKFLKRHPSEFFIDSNHQFNPNVYATSAMPSDTGEAKPSSTSAKKRTGRRRNNHRAK